MKLTEKQDEVLTILIEECSEVIQAATKMKRFGLTSTHPDEITQTNYIRLSKEIGDLSAMIHIAIKNELICPDILSVTAHRKFGKLNIYSTHLKNEDPS